MRNIPQVDRILRHPIVEQSASSVRRDILAAITRQVLADVRQAASDKTAPDLEDIAQRVVARAGELTGRYLRRVINGTGIILHTNLGRAPLSFEAVRRLEDIAGGYVNLEIDLDTGERGKRSRRLNELLVLLTGAEAALCVNNNAAAVVLAVSTFASGKEVVVSRGELIEIGGSFRLPEVILAGGARLREVGTTNRTRLADYRAATGDLTGLLLRCHRSNFRITGFTEEPSLAELVSWSGESGVPFLEDLGSGVLFDLAQTSFGGEPTVREIVDSGAGMVSFSGDKLLGGPQAGIIVGRQEYVERLEANPLYRALRLDKVAMVLLEETLAAYLAPEAEKRLPVLQMISEPLSLLEARVQEFLQSAGNKLSNINVEMVATESAAGGGSLPEKCLESRGIRLLSASKPGRLACLLRLSEPPVIGVVKEGNFMLDFRTIDRNDQDLLLDVLMRLDERMCTTVGRA